MPARGDSQHLVSGSNAGFNPRTLDCLACPVCYGKLAVVAAGIACAGCGRVYPLVDGIPVLIAERVLLPLPKN